jgi:hypothetical protein
MTEDEEAFYHRKLSGKKGVENDGNDEKYQSEKCAMPSLKSISRDIQRKQALDKSASKKGTTSDASLPGNSTKPAYIYKRGGSKTDGENSPVM